MKLTRFLIAQNPMVDGSLSAIVHTVEPKAILIIIEEGGISDDIRPSREFIFNNKKFTLIVDFLFTKEFDSEKHPIVIDKLLNRAWHWYLNYMKW